MTWKVVAQVTLHGPAAATLIVALTVGVFVLDVVMPLGFAPWILYLLPIWMARWFATAVAVPLVATICAGLTLIGWALSPAGLDPDLDLLNRIMGVGLFGLAAVFLHGRRRLERDLREQAANLQAVVGHLHEALITINERGIVESCNPAAERMFGYAAADVIGRNVSLLMPETDRSRHDDYLARYLSTGQAKIIGIGREVIGKRKDGSVFPMELGIAEMRLERGRVFIGSLRDITERKRMENLLARSRDFYLSILQDFPALIWRSGVDAKCDYFNNTWLTFTGRTLEQELGDGWAEGVHPDDVDRCVAHYLKAFHAREPFMLEYRLRRSDGEYRHILDYGSPFHDVEENFAGFVGACFDITERKQAEAVLKERHRLTELSAGLHAAMLAEARLDSMLQSCAEMLIRWLAGAFMRIWLLGPGDLCHACHKAAYCDNRNQCLHLTASDGLSRNLDGEYRRVPLGALKIGRIAQGEGPMHTNDVLGDDRLPNKVWLREHGLVAFAGQPLRIGDRVQGVMMIFSRQPLTHAELAGFELAAKTISLGIERKRAEAALRQLNENLQRQSERLTEANEELESYGQMVSHDLRAPLQGLMGNLGLLQRKLAPSRDETTNRYLTRMLDATKQMGQLITDLLAFAQSGHRTLDRSMVNFDAVVRAVVADLKPMTEGRDTVWDIAPLPTVQGDEVLLRQVFANLLGNAVKYTRLCPKAVIAVGVASASDAETVIFVKDNGAGFDMGQADRLFGTFQRLHSRDQFEGTGIGLASVRRIIERHGGRVWAEGAVDHGATFYVSLPRAGQS